MKIASVRSERKDHPRVPQILVRVEDEAGNVGIGEAWWGVATMVERPRGDTLAPIVATIDELLGPICIGRDADRISELWHHLLRYAYRYGDEGIVRCALSGIDLALWDLVGRRLEVPVARLFGGRVHDDVPAFASVPGQRAIEPLAREVRRALDAGFGAVKVHEFDADLILQLREVVGPEPVLMVDALGHFDAHDAGPFAARLAGAALAFLENPLFPFRDYRALGRVRRLTDLPLAAGEHEWAHAGFERLIESGAVDFAQPEITKIGGLTFARHLSVMLENAGIALCPHAYRLGPSWNATLHWALCSPATRWIEVPFLPAGIDFPSGASLPALSAGRVTLPDGPGLGRFSIGSSST